MLREEKVAHERGELVRANGSRDSAAREARKRFVKLDRNWDSFQPANSASPLKVTVLDQNSSRWTGSGHGGGGGGAASEYNSFFCGA